MPETVQAVLTDDFTAALTHTLRAAALAADTPMAVAVSGGPDSMALLHLARDHAQVHGNLLLALTVDHRLRPESTEEAAQVAAWCADLGLPHRILVWDHARLANPTRPEAARRARYALLRAACAEASFPALLLGHQEEDQAETLLHHLLRGSGVDGLSAMPAARREEGTWLLRPLLGMRKATLRASCTARGQAWIEDPSNENPRFARTLLRRLLGEFADQGFSTARLAETAAHMARAREALEAQTEAAYAHSVRHGTGGATALDLPGWRALPQEIRLRLLRRLLLERERAGAITRFASLSLLEQNLFGASHGRHSLGASLWHWRGAEGKHPEAWAYPDPRSLPAPATPAEAIPHWQALGWRFEPAAAFSLQAAILLAPLGEEGWEWLCSQEPETVRAARRLAPARAWQAMPCFYRSAEAEEYAPLPLGNLVALPHILPAGESLPSAASSSPGEHEGRIPRFAAHWQPTPL